MFVVTTYQDVSSINKLQAIALPYSSMLVIAAPAVTLMFFTGDLGVGCLATDCCSSCNKPDLIALTGRHYDNVTKGSPDTLHQITVCGPGLVVCLWSRPGRLSVVQAWSSVCGPGLVVCVWSRPGRLSVVQAW